MANLEKVIKVTQSQYDILASGGRVGDYVGLDDNYIYLIEDENTYITSDGGTIDGGPLHLDGQYLSVDEGNGIHIYDSNNDTNVAICGNYSDNEIIYNSSSSYRPLFGLDTYLVIYSEDESYANSITIQSDDFISQAYSNSNSIVLKPYYGKITYNHNNNFQEYTLPSSSGTLALTNDIKSLNTTASTAQSTSASESLVGSGTINLHKVSKTGSYNDLLDKPTIPTDTNQTVKVGSTTFGANDAVGFVAGTNITSITADTSAKTITINAKDTTYSDATTSASGLMSASDKTKLNGIASGAEVNVQADWNVTDSSSDAYIKNKPSIPTISDATITVKQTGIADQTFTLNGSAKTITLADNDTTYTFAEGTTNKAFTVTPSGGNAQTVAIHGLGDASLKGVATSVTSGSSNLVTSGAVYTAIDNLPEPMIYKGTLGIGGTITSLPTASSSNEGFTYKVITAGTYASQSAKVGDVFISNGSAWTLIPSGDDVEDTWRQINVNGTELLGTGISTGAVNFKNGSNVTISGSGNDITIASSYTDTNQKVKAGSVTFGNNDVVNIVAGDNVTVTGLASGTGAPKITISSTDTDTGATSVETIGSGNVVNSASYDATTRKLTLSKGVTALTSHQSIKTLKTDNTTAQSTSSSESITGSDTINLHKVSKTGSYNDLLNKPTIPTVNNGTLSIQGNGTTASTFTANQSGNTTLNIKGSGITSVSKSANNEITVSTSTDTLVKYSDSMMETNPFGGKKLYINSLYNAFACADKKYYVTITKHKRSDNGVTYPYIDSSKTSTDDDYFVDGPILGTLSASSVSQIFNGNYDDAISLENTGTTYFKIRIMFGTNTSPSSTSSAFPGYPYGKWYFSFYYNNTPNVATQARVYNKYTSHGVGWHLYNSSFYNGEASGTNVIQAITDNNDYERTCVEFIVYGNDASGRTVALTQIDYQLSRPNLAENGSTITKFGPMSLYHNFTWYNNHAQTAQITNEGNASFVSISENGTTLANKYQAKDADLTAIAGLTGTSGLLKKTAANTWTLDTTSYATGSITTTTGSESVTIGANTLNVVTRDTAQTISGSKTFNGSVIMNGATAMTGSTSISGYLYTSGGVWLSGGSVYSAADFRPSGSVSLGTKAEKWTNLFLSGTIRDGKNNNYGLALPDTTNYSADKTIATTADIPIVNYLTYDETMSILTSLTMPEGTTISSNNITLPSSVTISNNNIQL